MLRTNPEDIDVVILCGGLGTRLRRTIDDRPKVMAEINGRPFLDFLIDYISDFKFKRFILCIGYMKEFIKGYYEKKNTGFEIFFSEEKVQLGTAGAIKNAESLIKSNPFLVMNGDSFCDINLRSFLGFHISKKTSASIALVIPEMDADYGVVTLDSNQRILNFNEKAKPNTYAFINAGMYFFNRDIFEFIPSDINYSLEYELFPRILDKGIYGYITKANLIDIGTPARFKMAENLLSRKK